MPQPTDNKLYLPFDYKDGFVIENEPTHFTSGHPYAIDFLLDEGTDLFVPIDGVILDVKQHYSLGGDDIKFVDQANYVIIRHDDTTTVFICHLKKHSVPVEVGTRVKRGDFLAKQGSTGYTTAPHVHVAIYQDGINIPIRWMVD